MSRTKGTDFLYRLIHSLNKEEKIFIKRSIQNKTLRKLFDHVNRQKLPDEIQLKKIFPHYAVFKQRLFDFIIRQLYILSKDKNIRYKLMYQFVVSDILYKRGLQDKAIHLIEESIPIAKSEEDFPFQNILIRQHWSLTHQLWTHQQLKTKVREYFTKLDEVKYIQNISDSLLYENTKLGLKLLASWYLDPKISFADEPVNLELLQNKQVESLSTTLERRRLMTLGMYYSSLSEHEKAHPFYKKVNQIDKIILHERKHPYAFEMYINSLRLLMVTYNLTGRVKDMDKIYQQFREIKFSSTKDLLISRLVTINIQAMLFWVKGKHYEGERYVESLCHEFVETTKDPIRNSYFFDFLAYKILFHFSNRNFRKAVLAMNELRSVNLKKDAPAFYKYLEIFLVIMQLEEGNYDLTASFIKNILRRKKQLKISDTEHAFLKIIGKMNHSNQSKIYSEAESFLSISQNELWILSILKIKDWVQAKIKGKSLSEIIASQITR